MTHNSLSSTIALPSTSASDDMQNGVLLEQINLPPDAINLSDIYKMWLGALAGVPASHYKNIDCPLSFADGIATVWFDFIAYPVPGALDYKLSPSIGTIEGPDIVDVPKSHDIIYQMKNVYDLEYSPLSYMDDWQTKCYFQGGGVKDSQQITRVNNVLTVARPCFAVIRIDSIALAHKYRLTIEFEKNDNRINGLSPVITASWVNEAKTATKQLNLVVPKCVEFGLSLCAGDFNDRICQPNGGKPFVFYSVCDASYLGTRKNNKESWCGKGEIGYAQ